MGFLLFQLDEACRYIEDGRPAQLRLALVHLDNAAETLMDRRIRNEIQREEIANKMYQQLVNLSPERAAAGEFGSFQERKPLTDKQKKSIEKFFDEKVKVLADRWKCLGEHLVQPLRYLHKYRNEAYHKAQIRKETIDTACRLLLEINCQMLMSVYPQTAGYSSTDDHSWLEEKYGMVPAMMLMTTRVLQKAVNDLRSRALLDNDSVLDLLKTHIETRLNDLHDALSFIVENTNLPDVETAFKWSQYCRDVRSGLLDPHQIYPDDYEAEYSLAKLKDLQGKIDSIVRASDSLTAFQRFSLAEKDLEPVEEAVMAYASEVDDMLQMELDALRGK